MAEQYPSRRTARPFARWAKRLILENGKPLILQRWQEHILREYFRGARETVIIVPKKNGKTTLLAAIALWHLTQTEQAECVIAASSRDQARIMFNQAAKMIARSGLGAEFEVKHGYREIRHFGAIDSVIRVLAADADTADGVIPTLALVDELHRHKSAELYGVFADGLEPRNGQIITISTAGDDEDSPLGMLRKRAYELEVKRVGPYRQAIAEDKDFVLHEWALDEGDDVEDLDLVAEANPASWQTVAALRRRKVKSSMTPWRWKRFACGIWTDAEEPWIEPGEWDACRGEVQLDRARQWYLGVDIGQLNDSSAVCICGIVDEKIHVSCRIWTPEPKKPVRIGEVEHHVVELAESHEVAEIAYDPMRFNKSAEDLEERGMPMMEFPQTHGRMVPASNTLYDLVREGKVVHDGDELLTKHVMAGVAVEVESGWRISKKRSKKIDGLIALAMAADLAWRNREQGESPYADGDLVVA